MKVALCAAWAAYPSVSLEELARRFGLRLCVVEDYVAETRCGSITVESRINPETQQPCRRCLGRRVELERFSNSYFVPCKRCGGSGKEAAVER